MATDSAGNISEPYVVSDIHYTARDQINNLVGVFGGDFEIQDSSSKLFGTKVIIPPGAVDEDVNISANEVDLSSLPNVIGVPTPKPLGPILDFSVSKTVSSERSFNKPVVVAIPFSSMQASHELNNLNNLRVIRYNNSGIEVESLRPIKVDYEAGLAYILTDSFSYFFVADGKAYPKVQILNPTCIQTDQGQNCSFGGDSANLSGIFRGEGITSEADLTVTCVDCEISMTKFLTKTFDEDYLNFNIIASENLTLIFRQGNMLTKEYVHVKLNQTAIPADSNLLLDHCFSTGAICREYEMPSLTFGESFKPFTFKLKNSWTKSSGELFYIEPKDSFAPTFVIHNLVRYKLFEFNLQKRGVGSTLETLDSFKIAIREDEVFQSEWEHNFNLEVFDGNIFFTLGSSSYLYDQGLSQIDFEEGVKLIKYDTQKTSLTASRTLKFKEIKEVSIDDNMIYLIGSSFVDPSLDLNYQEGVFSYDLINLSWNYLTKTLNNPNRLSLRRDSEFSADGIIIDQFDGRSIRSLKAMNSELYFIDSVHHCVRKFGSSGVLSTISGICYKGSELRGKNVDLSLSTADLLYGELDALDVDQYGNLYVSQTLNNNNELFVIKEAGEIKRAISSEASQFNLGSNQAYKMDKVLFQSDLRDQRKLEHIGSDALNFVYRNYLYSINEPLEYLFSDGLKDSNLTEEVLSDQVLSDILLGYQNSDGGFSFSGDTFESFDQRLDDTLEATKSLSENVDIGDDALQKAKLWVSNLSFSDTSNLSKKLQVLSLLESQDIEALNPEIKSALDKLILGYRSSFSGWGSTDKHIIDNQETAKAIESISYLFNRFKNITDSPVLLSDFIGALDKIIDEQFTSLSGDFEGGFSRQNNQHIPSLLVTLSVVDSLLEFRKLDDSNDSIIAWNKKTAFRALRDTTIPVVIQNAIKFTKTFKNINGSFGDIKSTIKVLNTYRKILNSGIIGEEALRLELQNDSNLALSFIKNQNVSRENSPLLSGLSAVSNLSELGIKVSKDTSGEPQNTSRVPSNASQKINLLGDGRDGILSFSGRFNINQDIRGDRKFPDAPMLEVENFNKQFVYVNELSEGAIVVGDEVLIINLEGAEVGSYHFSKVKNIYLNESPILIQLEDDLENTNFKAAENDIVMLQRVPQYRSVDKDQVFTLDADSFNGKVGGVLAFRLQGEFPENLSINMNAKGHRSTTLTCKGANAVSGFFAGGGGAYKTEGYFVEDSNLPANSGATFGSNELTKIMLGCNGGKGTSLDGSEVLGGSGGGIVMLFAPKVTLGENQISAEGGAGLRGDDTSEIELEAGAGSGGSILIHTENLVLLETKRLSVNGGIALKVSDGILGQSGGDGRIRVNTNIFNGEQVTDTQKTYLEQNIGSTEAFIAPLGN